MLKLEEHYRQKFQEPPTVEEYRRRFRASAAFGCAGLAQESRDDVAAQTDQALDRYLTPSARLDRSTVATQVLVRRAWLLAELLWLGPGFVSGLQSVTTWQLSYGERGRLFVAGALLQGVDAVLLGATFAALDPETLSRTLPKVLEMAPPLLVIAHP